MIAPGTLNKVIIAIVHILTGILIFINEPKRFTANIITSAINKDLNNHFKNFFIYITPIIIWDKTTSYALFLIIPKAL